jgi:hypothetical protein
LEANADVFKNTIFHKTALALGVLNGHKKVVEILLNYSNSDDMGNALMAASFKGDCDLIYILLQKNANVNFEKFGETPLVQSVRHSKFDSVKLLVQFNANVNFLDDYGNSLLFWAAIFKSSNTSLNILKFLIFSKSDVNYVDKNGQSVLLNFLKTDNFHAAKILVFSGADTTAILRKISKQEQILNFLEIIQSYNDFLLLYEKSFALLSDFLKEIPENHTAENEIRNLSKIQNELIFEIVLANLNGVRRLAFA